MYCKSLILTSTNLLSVYNCGYNHAYLFTYYMINIKKRFNLSFHYISIPSELSNIVYNMYKNNILPSLNYPYKKQCLNLINNHLDLDNLLNISPTIKEFNKNRINYLSLSIYLYLLGKNYMSKEELQNIFKLIINNYNENTFEHMLKFLNIQHKTNYFIND